MNKEGVKKGVETLFQVFEKSKEGKNSLFDNEDDSVHLSFTFSKLPEKVSPFKPRIIPLPHPLKKEDVQICLFAKSPASKTKELLANDNITKINKIIDLDKLRKKYSRYEDRRKLSNSYDLFLADRAIIPSLPSALGKAFLQKKRYPIPITLDKGTTLERINEILSGTVLVMGSGVNSTVRVGNSKTPIQHIVDNILAATDSVLSYLPTQWNSMHSIHIKFHRTMSIPLYVVLPVAQVKINNTEKNVEKEENDANIEEEQQQEEEEEKEDKSMESDKTTQEITEEDNNVGTQSVDSKKRPKRYMDAKKTPTKRVKAGKTKQ